MREPTKDEFYMVASLFSKLQECLEETKAAEGAAMAELTRLRRACGVPPSATIHDEKGIWMRQKGRGPGGQPIEEPLIKETPTDADS